MNIPNYDDPEQPHDRGEPEERYETISLLSLLRLLHNQVVRALISLRATGEPSAAFRNLVDDIERISHEIKTAVGHHPASTGSRRGGVCNSHAVRLLRGNPRTACLLGGDGDERAAAGADVGHDLPGHVSDGPGDGTGAAGELIIRECDWVTCDYCDGEGCALCYGQGCYMVAHESLSE